MKIKNQIYEKIKISSSVLLHHLGQCVKGFQMINIVDWHIQVLVRWLY